MENKSNEQKGLTFGHGIQLGIAIGFALTNIAWLIGTLASMW